MFVSVSFIILMMVSLAWLVFYYIQRFRYLHAKDRLSVSLLVYLKVYLVYYMSTKTANDLLRLPYDLLKVYLVN